MDELLPPVPRGTREKLDRYQSLVEKWQKTINLIADGNDFWMRHIIDCAQITKLLPAEKIRLADFGSGAGLPGLVLAILTPHEIHLIESDKRKAAFLREAARELELEATIHNQRIEDVPPLKADVITARALAPLDSLLEFAVSHLNENAFCIFPKGINCDIEIKNARARWQFDVRLHPSVTQPQAALAEIRNLKPRTDS